MKKSRKWKALLLLLILLVHTTSPAAAYGTEATAADELIILFDISTSMSWYDTEFLAPDALRQLTGSLPSHWHVGLVTFDTDVVDAIAPSANSRALVHSALDEARYHNWTNLGAGLFQAMDLFSDNAASRTIVFMTDGEKANMSTAPARTAAEQLANEAIAEVIASDIEIHTIVIDYAYDIRHEAVMNLSANTGGTLFEGIMSTDLGSVISTLLFDTLGVAGNAIGDMQHTGEMSTFSVSLPAMQDGSAQILITADAAIDDITVDSAGQNVELISGERFAVIDVMAPQTQEFEVSFVTTGSSNAMLMLAWDLQLVAEVHPYEPMLQAWLVDSSGENVLHDPFFYNRTLPVSTDGVLSQVQVEEGYLFIDVLRGEETTHQAIAVHLDNLGILVSSGATASAIEVPAAPAQNNIAAIIAILVALLLLIALLIYLLALRPKQERKAIVTPITEGIFDFTGKLNIYVTRTPDDADIPPQTFDLFRLGGREISLRDVLEKCQIRSGFSGVERIHFAAGGDSSLRVVNNSDCTVLLGADILTKYKSCTLAYGEKIHVTCEDEISELELHYKSVKPGEKRVLVTPLIRQVG